MKSKKSNIGNYFETMEYAEALESDKEVRIWLKNHNHNFGHFIGGKFVPSVDKGKFKTFEPATGKLLAEVSQGTKKDVGHAVKAARTSLQKWQKIGGHNRAKHLYALARMVQRHARMFSVLEALDNGKPIRETRDLDIPLVARHFYYHAGLAALQKSEFPNHTPIGVVGQIIPWNFPLLMLAWKIAPALALGNTVVLKPAEYTPLTSLLFAELAHQSGLPNGVLNVVTGDGTTGEFIVEEEGLDKVAFTGSTEVGRKIREKTAGKKISLTLELGGKSPFIVFDDSDFDAAIEGVVDAIWFNQGQVCCAGSRLLVQESIAPQFLKRLKNRMKTLRTGTPLDKTIDMGAVVDKVQLDRITKMVEMGASEGAKVFQPAISLPDKGCFYPPTLLTDVHPAQTVATEEIFGPVLVSMTFRTPDEAVDLANNSRFGLSASIWSESVALTIDIAQRLKVGVVWVNSTNIFDAAVGFGGYRESGYGREGGFEGGFEYLKPKFWSKLKPRLPKTEIKRSTVATRVGNSIDRTAKLYIGGKQVRPDGNYNQTILTKSGKIEGEVGIGNRKDIRNAVEAARKAESWSVATSHNRAQVIYYIGENLSTRADEIAKRISRITGVKISTAENEVQLSIERLFSYAAWADKFEGRVHSPPLKGLVYNLNEPLGVAGVTCPPEMPLLSFVSLIAPLMATGNRLVVLPSETAPLVATDMYQIFETSDLPAGVVNIVTGNNAELNKVLAEHDGVDTLWTFGTAEMSKDTEQLSIGNMKQTFVDNGMQIDWTDPTCSEGLNFLRKAVQVKNVWIPCGV